MIEFKHKGKTGDAKLFKIQFHTAFIGSSNHLRLNRNMISPEKIHKDFETFPQDFSVDLFFDDFEECEGNCSSVNTELEFICAKCLQNEEMKQEKQEWLEFK